MLPAGKTGDELPGWIRSIHPNEEMILKDTKNTIEDTVEKLKLILQTENTNTVEELKTIRPSRNKNSLNGIRFDFRFGIHFRK